MGHLFPCGDRRQVAIGRAHRAALEFVLFPLALAAALYTTAQAADAAEGDGAWVAEYIFELPAYAAGINAGNVAADSVPARYMALVDAWAQQYQPEPADYSKQEWGPGKQLSNIHAWLAAPTVTKPRWNQLVHSLALHVEISSGSAAMLDALDTRLASPGPGLPPLAPAWRGPWEDYDRLTHPEAYAERSVVVDGQALRYPAETGPELGAEVRRYLSSIKSMKKLACLSLATAQPGRSVAYGPLFAVEQQADGTLNIRTIPTPWDFIPPGADPQLNSCTAYGPGETDAQVIRGMKSTIARRSSMNRTGAAKHPGVTLVYPLLPPERWEPGHPDDYYALEPSIAEVTTPRHAAYEAAFNDWLAGHPSFADADSLHDYAKVYPVGWGGTETRLVAGKEAHYYQHIAFLTFELQVYTEDAALLSELRALLDSVPGVHPRVERRFTMYDYGGGEVMFGD